MGKSAVVKRIPGMCLMTREKSNYLSVGIVRPQGKAYDVGAYEYFIYSSRAAGG